MIYEVFGRKIKTDKMVCFFITKHCSGCNTMDKSGGKNEKSPCFRGFFICDLGSTKFELFFARFETPLLLRLDINILKTII